MIISENRIPTVDQFRLLMENTDRLLNQEAQQKQGYYKDRNGLKLESDVFEALQKTSQRTPFENTIKLVSGASFPDIVADGYYGVEVKSTNKNHWQSIGSSILESTRDANVERIYLTFGKLAEPVQFLSRPYEECLSGISVTHYPRYQIDMRLKQGETIFDKMGIPYDELRKMDNPVKPVSRYYKSKLKAGESLWWTQDAEPEETAAPPVLRLWTSLTAAEKNFYTVKGYAMFPEILGKSQTKYQRYALWLASHNSVINTNIRDQFSAGGKVTVETVQGTFEKMPAAFGRIKKNAKLIADTILTADEYELCENWEVSNIERDRVQQWCKIVSLQTEQETQIYKMLCGIFLID